MVSVFITTKDQREHVKQCIQSVVDQDYDRSFEITVLDDASQDDTVEIVRKAFADRVTVVTSPKSLGWFHLLLKACEAAREDIIIFFDPHCVAADPQWLRTIVASFESDPEISIVTGPLFKGNSFMAKLTGLTLEAAFLSHAKHKVHYVEDDNFAIKKKVLRGLLQKLPVDQIVNDSAGSALLAEELKRQGLSVLYEPRIGVFHISPDFKGYLRRFAQYSAQTSITIRQLDPSIRGAKWLKYPLLAACFFPSVRLLQDIKNVFRFRKELRLHFWETPILLTASAIGKVWYSAGLLKILSRQ
ncbi:MAG: glycosyltransferase family 2 protein [Gemmatimonadota bacterium]|nr:MAG: glycosyltransferase family 2 protein [Gemmatimonadota bacterium]